MATSGKNVAFVFKDCKSEFYKRPEGDTVFLCREGEKIKGMVNEAIETSERVSKTLEVTASVPSISPEVVAKFELTLSLKKQK